MRTVLSKVAVFTSLLGSTIVALALYATNVASCMSVDPESRGSRHVASDALAGGPANGQQPRLAVANRAPLVIETIGAAAKMFPDGLTKDFGSVAHGTQLVHRFPITNNRAEPITIAFLQPSCSCVTGKAAKQVLQPGESTTIEVGLDGRRFTGPVMQNVRVKVDGPNFESTCKLTVLADGQEDVETRPLQSVQVQIDAEATASLR